MSAVDGGITSERPRVLVPEKLSPDGLALLRTTLDVDEKKGLSAADLQSIIGEYDALLIRSETKVSEQLLRAAKKLKVVARAGVGVDNVDVKAATQLGIIVVNSPSGNIGAAAEHTIALLMALARNVPDACSSLKDKKWERSRLVGVEVKGKVLGIIGLGKVGLIVARLAHGLGMNVVALDPYASPAVAHSASVTLVPSLEHLLPLADFLTIHTPLIAATKGMISSHQLNLMKPGSRVLNVARGGVFDELALLAALESGHIAGAGIDVFTTEPPHKDPESSAALLISHPKCIATPHLGASTVEAQENVSIDVCEQVLQILAGDLPRSAVNAPLILPAEYKTLQPFVKLVEKIGSLYTQHYTSPKHSSPRNNFDLIYQGDIAAMSNTKPLFAALVKGLTAPISDVATGNVNIVNAELIAKERGIFINEQKSRDPATHTYSSLVTLIARPSSRSSSLSRGKSATGVDHHSAEATGEVHQQIISGYCSDNSPFISRVDRFATSFVPEGNLLICHNYDSPGKIGVVGSILGREGVNINYMAVAPASYSRRSIEVQSVGGLIIAPAEEKSNEALMILGIDKEVGDQVIKQLVSEGGVLKVSSVCL